MAEQTESVKVRKAVAEIYREWATITGRTVSGTMDVVLTEGAQHFLDGQKALLKQMAKGKA